jgi:hypothetical protein
VRLLAARAQRARKLPTPGRAFGAPTPDQNCVVKVFPMRLLRSVTKRNGENYESFVRRAAANPIGRRVKLADLHDNCDLTRIAAPSAADFKRIEKYRHAIDLIHQLPQ